MQALRHITTGLRVRAWSFIYCLAASLRSIASDLACTAAKRRSRAILADVNAHRTTEIH